MACHFTDNVHTKSFTPREFQVELVDSVKERNVIVCLNPGSNKTFIVLKVLQELSNAIRIPWNCGGFRSLYIGTESSVHYYAQTVRQLTDLSTKEVLTIGQEADFEVDQVLFVTYDVCLSWTKNGKLDWGRVNLLVVEDCHNVIRNHPLREIILNLNSEAVRNTKAAQIRILGLTTPLFSDSDVETGSVEAKVKRLEIDLRAEVDTASDIVSTLRYSAHPRELVVECLDPLLPFSSLSEEIHREVIQLVEFFDDHRYDPTEIYEDCFVDELSSVPDPKREPYELLTDFLKILRSMGPYCADKAALVLLMHIEKLKVKTPYERHYLLLCLASSVFLKIRAICDYAFESLSDLEKINNFSTPKILRLIEIVGQFKPKKVENGKLKRVERGGCETNKNDLSIESKTETEDSTTDETANSSLKENGTGPPMCFICGRIDCAGSRGTEDQCVDEPRACQVTKMNGKDEKIDGIQANDRRFFRVKGRGRGWRHRRGGYVGPASRPVPRGSSDDADSLCGIVFVQNRFTAKILFHLFHDLQKCDPDYENISTLFTVGKVVDPLVDSREAEIEHRKQEDVLKRFRMRECNLVIATSVLEEGIELPRCNLVIRYDQPIDFRSHAHSKGRAKQQTSYYVAIVEGSKLDDFLVTYAQHKCTEKILLERCANNEPTPEEDLEADLYNNCVPPFKPLPGPSDPQVALSTALALVNRYCAKLPSDTFTRLAPHWSTRVIEFQNQLMFYTSVRLPINSPLKETIMGHPMPTKVLARRMAALETCRLLHAKGELDDNLEPIGKEVFNSGFEEDDLTPAVWDPNIPRPGTTKSRQYYYKRIASCLNDCRPVEEVPNILYNIDMNLTCPLPEEQNTRGRKLHPPELAPQSFGILTQKPIPKICPFPIFTRSGEVQVSLRVCSTRVILSKRNIETISTFLNFVFTSVLRLQKYLMSFDPEATENSFFIVPTKKNLNGVTEVDWEFLEVIYSKRNYFPHSVPETERENFVFDPSLYQDAVVMPWYRNQDQPQYFYVAEICSHLSPKSAFPGSEYHTFEDYYMKKYGIQIQDTSQPLLDVDHTSARLNFLTPRYVNRKGVALPTSSEETKRAKRENLEQKQILVAELCLVHVVPASLWRQAVCLPCILYRINALLLADEIRTTVAREIALGSTVHPAGFEWPPLDFGWSLADVLKKSKEDIDKKRSVENAEDEGFGSNTVSNPENDETSCPDDEVKEKSVESEEEEEKEKGDWMEIGTWSNEMAQFDDALADDLPSHVSLVRYGSPTSWGGGGSGAQFDNYYSDADSDSSDGFDASSDRSEESSGDNSSGEQAGLRITFKGDYLAEAVEDRVEPLVLTNPVEETRWVWNCDDVIPSVKEDVDREVELFRELSKKAIANIRSENCIKADQSFILEKTPTGTAQPNPSESTLNFKIDGYGMPVSIRPEEKVVTVPGEEKIPYQPEPDDETDEFKFGFSFDAQPDLDGHPGPSPSLLLQGLTMSNANDGINLERLETIGDSFLKYAITTYLYCTHENIHEGKLSHLRSKQVSNLKLYRLGQKKVFGESMIASKFEPHDNWLPPCYLVPRDAEREQLLNAEIAAVALNGAGAPALPYNLVTQHSIPDKSIADCVEALIGAYLIECGPRGALIFMSWLGIKVLPREDLILSPENAGERPVGSTPADENGAQTRYGLLQPSSSPLLRHVADPEGELTRLMAGFDSLERKLRYSFRDKSYLLQAMTHASYSTNRLTDCYQRLEFLGDAVLDYLITRHLYEDKRAHSPGALTDLRSALVNNTIFASLTVKHGLHKYFRHLSPGLGEVVQRFVAIQEENSHAINEEFYLVGEEAEDVEVPKALGDVFESVAGAIFLDSNMSLDTVWRVYYRMMKKEIEQFSTKVPKSPIRELLELEPETARFSKPEKLADGRRVRVTVEVFGKGTFKGIGRNYRIAKCTAAKCALKQLKKKGLLARKLTYYGNPLGQFLPF